MAATQPVPIDLGDGRKHLLHFGVLAIGDAEDRLGKSIFTIFRDAQWGCRVISVLLWAGLRHAEPTVTYEDTAARLDHYISEGGDLRLLVPVITSAVANALIPKAARESAEVEVAADQDPTSAGSENGGKRSSRRSSVSTASPPQPPAN